MMAETTLPDPAREALPQPLSQLLGFCQTGLEPAPAVPQDSLPLHRNGGSGRPRLRWHNRGKVPGWLHITFLWI